MATDIKTATVVPKHAKTDYPLIDTDPHLRRVLGYARPSDWAVGGGMAAAGPFAFWAMERLSPSHVGRAGFGPTFRLSVAIGLIGGIHVLYQRSCQRFYGFTENAREVERDTREMVDKVKKGEPLYGKPDFTPFYQGMAARNGRYSELFIHVVPWFNAINHNHHGVDTAKYYQQAERELEAERTSSS